MVFLHDIIEKMPSVLLWLDSFGINAKLSRFSKYANDIKVFFDTPFDTYEEKIKQFRILNKAIYECYNIILIYEAFISEKNMEFGDSLKRIIKGNEYLDDNTTDDARNIFFELIIASKLKKARFYIDLSSETDVIAKINNIYYHIECKKVASENGFENNLKKAGNQLNERLKCNNDNAYGIICIDISAIIVPCSAKNEFYDDHEYNNYIKESFKWFIEKHKTLLDRINERFVENSLGILLFYSNIINLHNPFCITLASKQHVLASKKLPDESYEILKLYVNQCDPRY